jgi:hypothetical protein
VFNAPHPPPSARHCATMIIEEFYILANRWRKVADVSGKVPYKVIYE